MPDPYLHMVGVSKRFPGVQALRDVEVKAFAGEAVALAGANGAGKSTLMNILGGVVPPDEGQVKIDGQIVTIHNPLDAARFGIAFVHQEMALLPTMTVAENLFIAEFPGALGLIDYGAADSRCRVALERLNVKLDPRTRVRDLSPGTRQMIEIARALLRKPSIVIFDEPTSSLTGREKARLFEVIKSLKADGVTVIYITHLLDEIYNVCERAVVLRNGEVVGSGLLSEIVYSQLVRMVVGGEEVDTTIARRPPRIPETVLQIAGFTISGELRNVSLSINRGEILGLWGLLGSGRTELARAMMGLEPLGEGRMQIRTNGGLHAVSPTSAINWIGMVTEDRRDDGLLLPKSVKSNITIANLRGLMSRFWPFVDGRRETQEAQAAIERLSVKLANLEQPVSALSGGNQQKVVLARWLLRSPMIYIMDEPTRGVDVGAKAEIRRIIRDLADAGASVLLISSDIDEILGLADRLLVMRRGEIVAEFPAGVAKDKLMSAAAGAPRD